MPYQFQTRVESLDSTTISSEGVVNIIDGRIYLCDWPLTNLARSFEGQMVEIHFSSVSFKYQMDPLITPLVQKLNAMGITTLSSCQGHIGDTKLQYPWISVKEDNKFLELADLLERHFTAHGWIYTDIDDNVGTLRTKAEAATESELQLLQESIRELVEAL